ncbi:carbohydrate porin [Methylobacterium sp. J-070]|uniref:carbohydrate porin n=1 Tax=Methylobacterium sp. J-070 TaxID=2836650 RepID=UPI001FB8BF9B|nr:carbohydrate porin [Methylobacterium sp. J-070]MCJ2051720.1 carbohydrate porin [Methylobacterium sp. J-070]
MAASARWGAGGHRPWTAPAIRAACVLAVALRCLTPAMCTAQNANTGAGGDPRTSVAQPDVSGKPSAVATTSIQSALGALGDPTGLRGFLADRGFVFSFNAIADILGDTNGGTRRTATVVGRIDMQMDVDLDRLAGWKGLAFRAEAYQINGAGLTRAAVNDLAVVSELEALPSTRLYELWVEQQFLGGQLAVKVGQIAADTEFLVSQTATLFINSTFGWPTIAGTNLPSGGPAYPFGAPAVRVKYLPNPNLSFQVGLFDGDPAGPAQAWNDPDPQRRDRTGTNFRLSDPPFLIAEAAYAYNFEERDRSGQILDEPGTVTVGGWHHFGRFDSLRIDSAGRSLADPSTTGVARRFRGNDGLYAIIDQTVFREPGEDDEGASVFVRAVGSPGDRNLVDLYVDAGIGYRGLLPTRSNDTAGVAVSYARISSSARGFDSDAILATGLAMPRRRFEAQVEATYQAVLGPGVTVQPNLQYVFHPGGNIPDPRDPTGQHIKNATIVGVRATLTY